jgi:O-antigen/teichoic acid export membrane protein
MASLADKAGFLITANFIKYAVGFALPMVMVRVLTQGDYGTYQQLLLVNSMAIGLLTLGLPSSIYYFYNRIDEGQRPALIFQTLGMLALAGTLATVGIWWGAPLIGTRLSNPFLTSHLPLYALAIGLMLAGEHFVHFMVAQDRYASAVWFEIIETFVRVTTLVLPVVLGYGLKGLVVAAVLYALLRYVVRGLWVLRGDGARGELSRARVAWFPREQLAYSIPLWLTSIVGVFAGLLDRGIVADSFSTIDFAIYSVGALSIPLDVIFQASVADVLRASLPPLVKNGNMAEVTRILREAVRKLSLIMLPSFVFRIYLFSLPLYIFVLSLVPQVFGRTRINLNIVLIVTSLHVALSFGLLKTVGFYGPALSAVISGYVGTFIYLWIASRLAGSSVWRLVPLHEIGKTLACALAAFAAAWLVGDLIPWKFLSLVVKAAMFTLVFFAAGILLKLFTEQDRSLVRRWAAKLHTAKAA